MVVKALLFSIALIAGASAIPRAAAGAQETARTVADGVYTAAQATRGATVYDVSCAGCHRADLGGGPNGPALRDARFARVFADKDLKTLFTKVATTMPRNAAGSLGENVYLDVVAHMLNENGFPPGSRELTVDALDAIRVLPGQPKPAPPIGDFAYVETVGCLTTGPHDTWLLTRASDPVAVMPAAPAQSSSVPAALPPGTQTFHLLDAIAYAPTAHKGHTIYVRGLLIKLPGESRITISAFEMVSPTCSD
jgi:mono/diheme cytochrome c family protein